MKSRVSERGQVTIPKLLRERLGIRAGEVLEFREESGALVATKTAAASGLDRFYGVLRLDRGTDALIAELRGPGEAPK